VSKSKHVCCIFIALACEAKALIQSLNLKKLADENVFAMYSNTTTILTISGTGTISMAAAVAYTLARNNIIKSPVLLNLGIAGHQTASLGSLWLAHKITDIATGKNFYPPLITQNQCKTENLATVTKPQMNYAPNCLYDMEASAFYAISTRFTTGELIRSYKVISDNNTHAIDTINAQKVHTWMQAHVDSIIQAQQALIQISLELAPIESRYYPDLIARLHFTVAAKIKLQQLLQRWQVLTNDADLPMEIIQAMNAKEFLKLFNKELEKL